MNRLYRTILCILCIMLLAGCSFTEEKGEYMSCLKLKRGKTVNIEIAPGTHAKQTAEEAGQMMKDQKRCVLPVVSGWYI